MFKIPPLRPLPSVFPSRQSMSHQDVLDPEVFNLRPPHPGTTLGNSILPDFFTLPPLHPPSPLAPFHPCTSTPEPSSSGNNLTLQEAFDMGSLMSHLPTSPFRLPVSRRDNIDFSLPRTPEQHRFTFSSIMGEPSGSLTESFTC
jgi:hypothetical protein